MKTIFIAIAAYNEPHLKMMIDNCLENAEYPERISFGIWYHYNDMDPVDFSGYKNIRITYINYEYPLGVGIARLGANTLYENEDYYLQVDGHMLFQHHWDSKLLSHYDRIKEKYDKPIISTYTRWWSFSNGNVNFYSNQDSNNSGVMAIDYENSIREKYVKPKNIQTDWTNKDYIEHHFISAHFLFADKMFMSEIMSDPLILFGGEEVTTAVRAWTRGYRIFTISNPIAWHLNKWDGDMFEKDFRKISPDKPKIGQFYNKENAGKQRAKDILLGNITGYWGAKDIDSLREYEIASGINFQDFYNSI